MPDPILLVGPTNGGGEFDDIPNTAVLELTAGLAARLLKMRDGWLAARSVLGDVYEVTRFDYSCEFTDTYVDIPQPEEGYQSVWGTWPRGEDPKETETRHDAPTAHATEDGVHWHVLFKYGSGGWETGRISWEQLEDYLAGKSSFPAAVVPYEEPEDDGLDEDDEPEPDEPEPDEPEPDEPEPDEPDEPEPDEPDEPSW